MGFFDSFKTGLSGVGDFFGDVFGAALGAAPTIIPLLQQTGVLPSVQQSQIVQGRGPGPGVYQRTALPGGAPSPFPYIPRVNPMYRNQPYADPVGFPAGIPTFMPTSPTGVVPMPAFQSTRGGFQQAALQLPGVGGFDLPFIDIVGQGGGGQLARLTSPFVPTAAGARAQPYVASNPVTGKLTWFKPAGRPILWSGDLTACKRVSRIASRARRVSRKR